MENKRIGARIQLPDDTMVTTTVSPYNFFITLVGNPPVVYTTDTITVARFTVDKGEIVIDVYNSSGTMISSSKMPLSQDNYYISSSVHDLVKPTSTTTTPRTTSKVTAAIRDSRIFLTIDRTVRNCACLSSGDLLLRRRKLPGCTEKRVLQTQPKSRHLRTLRSTRRATLFA